MNQHEQRPARREDHRLSWAGIYGSSKWVFLLLILLSLAVSNGVNADVLRTQTIDLQEGWNAVFLEVNPTDSDPAKVFADLPIDMAASYYAPDSPAQFVTDPGRDLFREAGWGVWYAESRPDAFLKSLHAIYGQRAYLVHATQDCTWNAEGEVVLPGVKWQPDAYNFVGFGVHAQAAPTFAQFFSGSKAHGDLRVYRLENSSWRRVTQPDGEAMKAGEAFWIYCEGSSKHQGPLRVETRTFHGLVLESGEDSLVLRNPTGNPVTPTLEHVVSGDRSLPLSIVVQALGAEESAVRLVAVRQPEGAWTQPLPPLEAGQAIRVPLELRLQDMDSFVGGSLLKISTDMGTEVWIPVLGIREDLKSN